MSVKASVIFWRDGKDVADWGRFDFDQLPLAGERITVRKLGGLLNPDGTANPDGTEDLFQVLKVEHIPATEGGEGPVARLLCEWISGRSG